MGKTIDFKRGHYHISLENEILRIEKELKKRGRNITRKEATAILAQKSKKAFISDDEIQQILGSMRGLF